MTQATPSSPSARPKKKRRIRWFPWAHQGAAGYIAFVSLGLALLALHLPSGPLPPVVLIADAPFLWLLFNQRGGDRWKRWALVYGAVHFAFAMRWLSEIQPMQVVASGLILGPTFLVWGGAVRMLVKRGAPFAFTVGVVVVLEEIMRTRWMGGMPWPARSLAFASDQPLAGGFESLVASSAFFGSYALSFVAGMCSAVFARIPFWLSSEGESKRAYRQTLFKEFAFVVVVMLALVFVGRTRMNDFDQRVASGACYTTKHDMLAIQANVPQKLKNAKNDSSSLQKMFRGHVDLSCQALLAVPADKPLPYFSILWPETMIPWPFLSPDLAAQFPRDWRNQVNVMGHLRGMPRGLDRHWLIGAIYIDGKGGKRRDHVWSYPTRDSLFHVRPQYAFESHEEAPVPDATNPKWLPPWAVAGGRHDKVRLVPGGEYTPLGDLIPPLKWFREWVSGIPELEPGSTDQEPFTLSLAGDYAETTRDGREVALRIGTVICFEVAFPARCLDWRRAGSTVLLNPANYAWFGETDFRGQVNAMSRLRAAEGGVTLVMAGNTGPTCFYDPVGRPFGTFFFSDGAAPVPCDAYSTTFRAGWARAPMYVDPVVPLYVRVGNFPWYILGALLLAWTLIRSRKRDSGS